LTARKSLSRRDRNIDLIPKLSIGMPIQCLGHDNIFESAFRSCVSLKHMEIADLPKLGFDAYTIFFGFQKKMLCNFCND